MTAVLNLITFIFMCRIVSRERERKKAAPNSHEINFLAGTIKAAAIQPFRLTYFIGYNDPNEFLTVLDIQ